MKIISSVAEMKQQSLRSLVVLVPTMGALHGGHIALIARARELAGRRGKVVVSLFVNPTQFGPREDLANYPRDFEGDRSICRAAGVDVLFAPNADELYHPDASTKVEECSLSQHLCGASRPGHFPGVCLIVLKLFHLTRADIAVFGKKDFQQLAVIQRMVRDLDVPIQIEGVETVRESDGLAMSSRNQYLTGFHRQQAPNLHKGLLEVNSAFHQGEKRVVELLKLFREYFHRHAPRGTLDYSEIVDQYSMEPVCEPEITLPAICAVAAHFGTTRLIDNIELIPKPGAIGTTGMRNPAIGPTEQAK